MGQKRRDAGRERGEAIERAIIDATITELARHGVDGLRISRIADASEVNKTTIYRRWPTKDALIIAALEPTFVELSNTSHDHGSLRADLIALTKSLADLMRTEQGRAVMLVAQSDAGLPYVASLSASPLVAMERISASLLQRASERGEWDISKHPPHVILPILVGAVMHRVMLERAPTDADWSSQIVDFFIKALKS